MFGKKKIKCERCESKVNDDYDFCPYCGLELADREKESKDFGMLGKNDLLDEEILADMPGFGEFDKLVGSLMGNLARQIEKQLKQNGKTQVRSLPNGIAISVGVPMQQQQKRKPRKKDREMTDEQVQKLAQMPKVEVKADVKRLGEKVFYELDAPGIETVDDVFVSKLENGYDVKAIGKKKVYVKSIPVELPMKSYSIKDDKLIFEFLEERF